MVTWILYGLYFGEEAGARNLVFFRVKWLQPAMKGTSSVRRLRLRSFCARIFPLMCFVTSGCSCVRSFHAVLESLVADCIGMAASLSSFDVATCVDTRSKPAPIYVCGNIKGRQWSSHSNAICNQRFKKRMELRTQEQLLVAKHIGGTIRAQNDRSRNRCTDEVPFIAGCNYFTRKNTRFRTPTSFPKYSPCKIHAAMIMPFTITRSKPAPIYARGNIK